MTFNEWKNSLTDEQKAALELSRKKDANKTADKLQFAEYKNRLGTKITGRSFDKWQEMKYTDLNKWATIKTMYSKLSIERERVNFFMWSLLLRVMLLKRKALLKNCENQR